MLTLVGFRIESLRPCQIHASSPREPVHRCRDYLGVSLETLEGSLRSVLGSTPALVPVSFLPDCSRLPVDHLKSGWAAKSSGVETTAMESY